MMNPSKSANAPRNTASSPERLLDILLMFEGGEPVTVQQISTHCGGSRSSTYRDLGFLKSRGFLVDIAPGTFSLGTAFERLASAATSLRGLGPVAKPHLDALCEATRESVLLCRKVSDRTSMLIGIDGPQMLRVSVAAADGQPLHCGSFGKVLLAYQRDALIDGLLAQPLRALTRGTIVDPVALRAELDRIRKRGHAISEGEVEEGVRSISVPAWSCAGDLLGSITVAGPALRLTASRTKDALRLLHRAAAAIAADLDAVKARPPVPERRQSGSPESP